MRRALAILVFGLLAAIGTHAQTGLPAATVHGIASNWGASVPGSNPIAGYNLWRCTGDATVCTLTSTNWTKLNVVPIVGLSYLDPAAGLSVNTTYSYVVFAQDTQGELSGPSNISPCPVGSTFPSNATVPGNLKTATQ